jgi:hypothetical protein
VRHRALATRLGLDGDVLEAAAWLHDIGYADVAVVTGFIPLTAPWSGAPPSQVFGA